jgi:N-acetyl sugar amidotransferase
MDTFFNLPEKVVFCKKCVLSNQRPSSIPEFKHTKNRPGAKYLNIDPLTGICDACKVAEIKNINIDWEQREKELLKVLDKHRSKNKDYDCIVPGSGGKDSVLASHILKYKYGMNPLTITWPPILYTDYGYKNFRNWIEIGGFDNLTFNQNGRVMKLLTKLSIQNLLHPFQTFILGQKNLAPKIANKFNIPLVFYGESEAEYGNPIADHNSSLRKNEFYTYKNIKDLYLAGCSIGYLEEKFGLSLKDLSIFFPIEKKSLENFDLNIHYLGYYIKWIPQEAYYYAVENSSFKARPFRTEGTYSKYNSIDDKIDDLHYYTTFVKYGLGRTSYDASQEIRNKHLNLNEGKLLVKKYDGEFPERYFDEIMDYIEMDKNEFHRLCDEFRSPHLWVNTNKDGYKLRHTVNEDGEND